jgi:hypothetical protein
MLSKATSFFIVAVAFLACTPCEAADPKSGTFEGTVTALLSRAGGHAAEFVFTRKGDLLRIENKSNKLEPINIIDLKAKKLTIVYPHNTTYVCVDLTKKRAEPGAPGMPNFPNPMRSASLMPATTPEGKIGPSLPPPPGFPTPPPMPKMPNGKMPAPNSMRPPIPKMFNQPAELKKTDKTKEIQGFKCALYTVSDRGQEFNIWATNGSALFPFRLIERNYLGRKFGPQMIEETWPELLRRKSLFPLEAILLARPGGQARLTFRVDKIERKKIESEPDWQKLFQPPDKYIEIQAPRF